MAKNKLKVLQVTTELTPFAKAGGLGDVVGYLPKALAENFSVDIRIVMPKYESIDIKKYQAEKIIDQLKIQAPDGKNMVKISVWKAFLPDTEIPVYLVDCLKDIFPDGLQLYNFANSHEGVPNYLTVFISKAALELAKSMDWRPDVVHFHDGFGSMIPKWIKTIYKNDRFFKDIATVMTIHNLATQPIGAISIAKKIGLKRSDFASVIKVLKKKEINLTAEGIENADMLNTVSATYAREILTKKYGGSLYKLLRKRKNCFTGIINGIDYSSFDPRTNQDTPVKYWVNNLEKKVENKLILQKKLGLNVSAETPLICAVTRIHEQKGLELIDEITDEIVGLGAQFVILGSGEDKIEKLFIKAEDQYPKQVAAEMYFDANFAQTIYAAADIFVMPSKFEPCGLSQIIAMHFGTVPIVRKTGGLADTVKDGYTGFVFREYDKHAFLWAIRRAVDLYLNNKSAWKRMQIRGMKKDFSWKASAKKYIWLYKKAIAEHQKYLRKNG